jgi:cell wall-associated NlpC family hydrolase
MQQTDGNLVMYSKGNLPLWTASGGKTGYAEDTLPAGAELSPGEALWSTDGQYEAVMQGDGNFVEYAPGGKPTWSTGTSAANSSIAMQTDGNLVVYSPSGQAQWASSTEPSSNDRLVQQTDGNLVIYGGDGSALWDPAGGRLSAPTGSNPSPSGQSIVDEATKWVGQVPYCWDGGTTSGPSHGEKDPKIQSQEGATYCLDTSTQGFDCTGLTLFAVYQASGGAITLPHDWSQATAAVNAGGQKITNTSDLEPGDLVYFGGTFGDFEHSGIYIGNGNIVDANIAYQAGSATRPDGVHEEPLSWQYTFVGGVRMP